MTLESIQAAIKELDVCDQERLLEFLTILVQSKQSVEGLHSIRELKGLGREIWQGIDAQEYVNRERESWGG